MAEQGTATGRFMLTDHLGRVVSDEDLKGKFNILYFGYTSCPDICPTSLYVLSKTLDLLGDKADLVQPYFITVDPQRDTVEVMRDYVKYYDKRLIGLTGDPQMIARLAAQYKVKYEKVLEEGRDPDLYVMDHSASLYLVGPDGQYVTKFLHGITPERLHSELLKHLR
jgi:protein SCO1/2